jgi:hypothetical protein
MVKTEFSFGRRPPGGQFSAIDTLLTENGMLLFGMQYNISPTGELNSGDAVYLRSIETIINSDEPAAHRRSRILKLICLCHYIRNLEYAYIVTRAAYDNQLLTAKEEQVISAALQKCFYLPAVMHGARWTDPVIQFLSIIQVLLAGNRWRNKSLPKPNRVDRHRILTVPTFTGRHRLQRHLEDLYQEYRTRICSDMPHHFESKAR